MLYTIYQVTNIVNNKIYIGVHKTNNPNDSYMGSGIAIRNAIKKYGKENFKKEVLFVFENKEDAFKKEQELVNSEFISTSKTYNGKLGGCGGWDHVRSPEVQNLAVENLKKFYQSEDGIELRKQMSEKFKGRKLRPGTWTVSNKQKENMSKRRQSSKWITDGNVTKTINIDEELPKGWRYGRSPTNVGNNPNICKKYILIQNGDEIAITNLKSWCNENHLNYANIFNCVDKGIINKSDKFQSPTRKWMIGKEIKSLK